ncbi:MAG: hypothetical protein PHW02_00105 [bacterium]|nr:hypothetical protein [bacterium]
MKNTKKILMLSLLIALCTDSFADSSSASIQVVIKLPSIVSNSVELPVNEYSASEESSDISKATLLEVTEMAFQKELTAKFINRSNESRRIILRISLIDPSGEHNTVVYPEKEIYMKPFGKIKLTLKDEGLSLLETGMVILQLCENDEVILSSGAVKSAPADSKDKIALASGL